MNFWNPIFGFRVPRIGMLDIWCVETPKSTPSGCLSISTIDLFAGYRKFHRFLALAAPSLKTFGNFWTAESATHTFRPMCLPRRSRRTADPLYIGLTGAVVHFSALLLPGSAFAPTFLMISPPLLLLLLRAFGDN